jgi:hypothetical protein
MTIKNKCIMVGCEKAADAKGYCNSHYRRYLRHGHVHDTRPSDYGNRHKHTLYGTWRQLVRVHADEVCEEWKDFWAFARDVAERPKEGTYWLVRLDDSLPYSSNNWCWRPTARGKKEEVLEKRRRYQRNYRINNQRSVHNTVLKKFYGISVDEYEAMLKAQDGVCRICGSDKTSVDPNTKKYRRMSVDHCHATGKVRGLLCCDCNRGLGYFKDNPVLLHAAIDYLSLHSK